jgi:hypothetical protein
MGDKENKREQKSMPRVGFEPTTPMFECAKTFHALDCAATVSGKFHIYFQKNKTSARECNFFIEVSACKTTEKIYSIYCNVGKFCFVFGTLSL